MTTQGATRVEHHRLAEAGVPARLKAARLSTNTALTLAAAAKKLGIPASTLGAAERGHRSSSHHVLSNAQRVYAVTSDFLRSGIVVSETDARADRLRRAMEIVNACQPGAREDIASRLRRCRFSAGYQTATEAARTHGWIASTYIAHDAGRRKIPAERLALYATAFDVHPTYIVQGKAEHEPMTPDFRRLTDTREREQNGAPRSSFSVQMPSADTQARWAWLSDSPAWIPVLRPRDGSLLLLDDVVKFPRAAFPLDMRTFADAFYGVMVREGGDRGSCRITILTPGIRDPGILPRPMVYDGSQVRPLHESDRPVRGDPTLTRGTRDSPVLLGNAICVVGIHLP